MNPLDIPGAVFCFEARNITARAASSKDGPKYKIGIEVDKATFDAVITANVEGAVFAFVCNRVDLDAADESFIEANIEETAKREVSARLTGEVAAAFVASNVELSKGPTGPRCREAVGLMKEKDFADYVKFVNMSYNGNDTPKELVQITCNIKSRREFDEGPDADKKYALFCAVKRKYREWQGHTK